MSSRRLIFSFVFFLLPFLSFQFVSAADVSQLGAGISFSSTTPTQLIFPSTCLLANSLVRASFLVGNTKVSAGSNVIIAGTIDNLNSYPVSDLTLVARVVKLQKKSGSSYDMATDTVDRIIPLTGIYLNPKATASFSFNYPVPRDLVTGPYQVDLFLNGSDQFAIGGNEYLNIPLATYPLAVTGTEEQTSFFDLPTMKVNGVVPMTQMLSTITVPTAVTSVGVENTYTASHNVTVGWYLYSGNFINPTALVATETDSVQLSPNKNSVVSFTYNNFVHAKYLLVGELKDGDKESMFSLRIGRSDIVEPGARSLYLSNFPISAGVSNSVAGCLTQNYSNTAATTTVDLSLVDSLGKSVWSGGFSERNASSYPFQIHFSPTTNIFEPLTLSIKTTDQYGTILASSSVLYICDANRCPSPKTQWTSNTTMYIYYAIAGVLVILAIVVVLKKKKPLPQPPTMSGNI